VDLSRDEKSGIAHVRLNYPERKNALSGTMMVQLRSAIETLEQWKEGRAAVIYGAERFFCSGGDLNTVKQILSAEQGEQMSGFMSETLTRLQALPLVTVALIEGKAIGGGAELITACDFRLAVASARIGFVHRKMGITTGWSGGTRLVGLIGRYKALDLLLNGRQLDAIEAKSFGLVDEIGPAFDDQIDLIRWCNEWLCKRIEGPIEPLRAIKRMVHLAAVEPLSSALACELQLLKSVWGQEAHRNALEANIKHRL
jgi:ethylmalonyl-CoA/methylmalonyl-CoA decarboxylase